MRKSMFLLMMSVGCNAVEPEVSKTVQLICTGDQQDGCCPSSPIIVDLAGDGIHLTSAEDGVLFQLHPGRYGQWAWTAFGSDDAFLALDIDNNGVIDNGAELFGDGSAQVATGSPNGFAALQYYDLPAQGGNDDGFIDAQDAVWPRLRLWVDADHNGLSDGELTTLSAQGVHSFSLVVTPSDHVDEHGNEFRYVSTIVADAPVSRVVSDVWLVQVPIPVAPSESGLRTDFLWTCTAWYYATDPNDPEHWTPCNAPAVSGEPIVTRMEGRQRLRRVARTFSAMNDNGAAQIGASDMVNDLTIGQCNTDWNNAFSRNSDPFQSLPHEITGNGEPRAKCHSTRQGGGGTGGCFTGASFKGKGDNK